MTSDLSAVTRPDAGPRGASGAPSPLVTVVFLLYNAAASVPDLVAAMRAQRHPAHRPQAEWARALFVDDASRDSTVEALRRAVAQSGEPVNWDVSVNPANLGLAGTLNAVLRTIRTPYALTCHCDCLFGREDYVATAVSLMEERPRAAAITGHPVIDPGGRASFAEKLNVITNLMDVLPLPTSSALVPVAFAEGRCDIFRVAALTEVGFYDSGLRTSGEDQLLAADLRERGYEILQAAGLPYRMRLSDEQNSVRKLVRHQHLFGRTQPFILFSRRGAIRATVSSGGPNRRARAMLRLSQLAAIPLYAATIALPLSGAPALTWPLPLVVLVFARTLLFFRHVRATRPTWRELLAVCALQPALDAAYTAGFIEGTLRLVRRGAGPIR